MSLNGHMVDVFPDYSKDGMTKQSFKDSTDVNKILAKFQKTGVISHLAKFGPEYGNFSDVDFMQAQVALARGKEIFEALPAEVKREFKQDAGAFFAFVNDPGNKDRLKEVLPAIAEPGSYFPEVVRKPVGAAPPQPPAPAAPDPAS